MQAAVLLCGLCTAQSSGEVVGAEAHQSSLLIKPFFPGGLMEGDFLNSLSQGGFFGYSHEGDLQASSIPDTKDIPPELQTNKQMNT